MTPEKNENFLFVCLIRDKPLELRRNQQKLTVFFKKNPPILMANEDFGIVIA